MGKHGIKTGAAKAAEKQAKRAWRTKKPPWEQRNLSRADKVIRFCEVLPITSGIHAGRRLKLRPWQKDIVNALYREENGKRIVRNAVVSMPRKNGKTALAAALALAHLIGPECEERGQVVSAASDKDQASIIFREMEALILRIPEFAERCNIRSFVKEIIDLESGSTYKALTADGRKAHGLNLSFCVYDELAMSKDRQLFDNLSTGSGARAEPLMLTISTQSADPHHVLSELVDYAVAVQEGSLPNDPSFYGCVFAAPDACDPWDEQVWFDANPALDDFRSLDEMRDFAGKAKQMPQREAVFKNLYLNMRISTSDKFITSEAFDACTGEIPDLTGRPVVVGLDLAAVKDLTAAVICTIPDPGEPYYIIPFAWVPGDSIVQRTKDDRLPYETWRRQGFIESIKGGVIDYEPILAKIGWIKKTFDLRFVIHDRWGAQVIVNRLKDMDIDVLEMGQGYASMSPPIRELEKLVLEKGIVFQDSPVLKWCFSNIVVEEDASGNRKFSKGRAVEKIDLAIGTVMALDGAIRNRAEPVAAAIGWL